MITKVKLWTDGVILSMFYDETTIGVVTLSISKARDERKEKGRIREIPCL